MDTLKEGLGKGSDLESMLFWVLVVFGGILSISSFFFSFTKRSKTQTKIPSPVVPTAPCGILEAIRSFGGTQQPTFLLKMMDQSGSDIFKLRLPIKYGGLFVVGNPKAAREVLLDRDTDKPQAFYSVFDSISKGPTMFTRTNKDAKFHAVRKGVAPAFSSPEVKRVTRICNERLEDWMQTVLEPKIAKNETFDPTEEMLRLLFFMVMEVAFESDITEESEKQVRESLDLSFTELLTKDVTNPLRKMFGLFIPSRRRAVRAATDVHGFMSKLLETYREKTDKSTNNTIIKLVANDPAKYENEHALASDMIMFTVASHESTAVQLSTILVLLARHPEVAEKLRTELAGLDPREWGKSAYLHCVISESLRFFSSMPTRQAGRTFYFKDGSIVIPEGAMISIPTFLIHRNRDVFSNPDIFDPERWVNPSQEAKDAFMPFLMGTRNCMGQRLATTELYSCVPMLISKYKFEEVEEGELVFNITLKYEGARLRAVKVA